MGREAGTADNQDQLQAAINRLYQLPLDDFVGERNKLVADLRKAGNRDAVERVKGLAKPSVSAWAVNHAWWTARSAFDELLRAGERLRAAQSASLQAKDADLRGASEARQQAVNAVVAIAVDALGGPDQVSPSMRQRIAGTCDALATGIVPPGVTIGRLTADLQPAGLDVLSALLSSVPASSGQGAAPGPEPRATRREPDPAPTISSAATKREEKEARASQRLEAAARARAEAVAAAEAAMQRAETALRDAEAAAARAGADEDRARTELDRAAARVSDAEAELTRAREAEAAAQRKVNEAKRAKSAADFTRARAARAVEDARRRLRELEK